MLRQILQSNNIEISQYGMSSLDLLFIEEMIEGTPEENRRGRAKNKHFLYGMTRGQLCNGIVTALTQL